MKWSRWVRTPITLGMPCTWQMLRNSNTSISKPNEASTRMSTRSATLATSIMALTSLEHSMKRSLCLLPETTVGQIQFPLGTVCFE